MASASPCAGGRPGPVEGQFQRRRRALEGDAPVQAGVAAVYTPKDFELVRIMSEIVDLATSSRGR